MSISHKKTWTHEVGNNTISYQRSFSADQEINTEISVPDSSTDLQVVMGVDISEIKSAFVVSDQDVTIETNDGTTPADTFAMNANRPLDWDDESPVSNPFSADITGLYITNASGSAATVRVRIVLDATP